MLGWARQFLDGMISVEASPAGDVRQVKSRGRISAMPVVSDPLALSALLDEMLERAELSQADLCRRLGLTPQTLSQYRSLRRGKGMRLSSFLRWASACGCQVVVECPE